jgi:hypothetical protein
MKRLADYIAESAFARDNPVPGDDVDFVFNEELCVSTQVLESSKDRLVIDADEILMSLLEHCGCAFESDGESGEDAQDFKIGDDVIITGNVRYQGATGVIKDFGENNRFVVVDLYNHGPHSFHSSDVSANDYADSDAEEAYMYDRDEDFRRWNSDLDEAKYQGREVKLGKPMSGDVKKYKVYVRDPKTGNIKKVNFGDKKLSIKRDDPKRRRNFRARHNCAQAKDRTSAKYWSCRMWSKKPVSKILRGK